MKAIFGPRTQQVLTFLTDLWRLSPEDIKEVSRAWKKANDLDRAEAWAQLQRATSKTQRYRILAAAAVARRQAMDVAYMYNQTDWAFWAAAWDAAAAIAAGDGPTREYEILTAPLTTVLSSLSKGPGGAQVPAQRSERRTGARRADISHDEAAAGQADAGHAKQPSARGARAKGADMQ